MKRTGRPLKYSEKTKPISFRVPIPLKDKIKIEVQSLINKIVRNERNINNTYSTSIMIT